MFEDENILFYPMPVAAQSIGRGSAPAQLPAVWFRIPPGTWRSAVVSVVCCQVEVSATG